MTCFTVFIKFLCFHFPPALKLLSEGESSNPPQMDKIVVKSNCDSGLWEGQIKQNQTLMGGLDAGKFTEHGQKENIGECMSHCCVDKNCDLAFMINKDCYTVNCTSKDLCKAIPARTVEFIPQIVFKKISEGGMFSYFS